MELAEGGCGLGLVEARDLELSGRDLGPLERKTRGDFLGSTGLGLEHGEHRAGQDRACDGGAGDCLGEEVALVDGGDCFLDLEEVFFVFRGAGGVSKEKNHTELLLSRFSPLPFFQTVGRDQPVKPHSLPRSLASL